MVVDGIVDVFEGSCSLVALDINIFICRNVVEVEVLSVGEVTTVIGGVVDDDSKVIGIILSENGIEVVFNTHVDIIVIGAYDKTHRYLLFVLIEMIELVESVELGLLLIFLEIVH